MSRLIAAVFALLLPALSVAQNYSIGTGGQSGIYYPLGGALAKVWSDQIEGINVKAEVSAASVENTIKVVRGDMIAGIAMGNVVMDAYKGEGQFPGKLPVNVLFALYPNLVHPITLADSDIKSLSDLKGKRVSLGAPGSGTAVTSAALLDTLGIDPEKDIRAVYLNYSETTNALANGQIDAGFLVSGQGVGAIAQIALTHEIRMIPVSDKEQATFIARYPAYSSYTLPEGVYSNVSATDTLSIWNVIVVREDMSVDLAYNLARTAYENMDEIKKVVNVVEATTLANADRLSDVPLHPGTIKYLNSVK